MKLSDHPTKVVDEVITEVRAIKRGISERHGNDIDRLLTALISQERDAGNTKAAQAMGGHPPPRCPIPLPPRSNGGGATT